MMMMIHVPCSSTFRPPHLLPLLAHTHTHTRTDEGSQQHHHRHQPCRLVHRCHCRPLPPARISPLDPAEGWERRGGKGHTKHACKYIKRNEYLIDPPHHPVLYSQSGWLDVSAGCARFGWPPMPADIKTKDTAQIKNNNTNNKGVGGPCQQQLTEATTTTRMFFFFFFFSIRYEMRSKRARAHARAHSPAGMPGLYPPDFWPVSRSPFFSHEKR